MEKKIFQPAAARHKADAVRYGRLRERISRTSDRAVFTRQLSTMSGMRTVLSAFALIGGLGVGYGMWAVISPGEERRRETLKNLPESNPLRMEETRRRNTLVMQALKDAAETNDNLARELGPSK